MNILDVFRQDNPALPPPLVRRSIDPTSRSKIDDAIPAPEHPGIINVPFDATDPAYRQNDAMISFNHIFETGNAPFTNDASDLTIDLEVDDEYNQAVQELRETVTNRITNPAADDDLGQSMNALLEKQPWSPQDRVDWERGLSEITSTEMALIPGFDKYRTQREEGVDYDNNVNTVSIDLQDGTHTREFDCDTMSFTEGMIIQSVENDLLPTNPSAEGDMKYAADYYIMPNNVDFSMHQDIGYHAVIVSSATGNIIEGTAVNNPYRENVNPDHTFEDVVNGKPFVADNGAIYSFSHMTQGEADLIRYENGEYDGALSYISADWQNLPASFIPEGLEILPELERIIEIDAEIEDLRARLESAGPVSEYNEHMIDALNQYISELEGERENIITDVIENGQAAELTTQILFYENAYNRYEQDLGQDYASMTPFLNTQWLVNVDNYERNEPVDPEADAFDILGGFGGLFGPSGLPADYEMSENMEYILGLQANIERLEAELANPAGMSPEQMMDRQRGIAESERLIDERLDQMAELNQFDAFENEMNILFDAQSEYEADRFANLNSGPVTQELSTGTGAQQTQFMTFQGIEINPDVAFNTSLAGLDANGVPMADGFNTQVTATISPTLDPSADRNLDGNENTDTDPRNDTLNLG